MKPIKFPECNIVYAENQEEYLNLPAYKEPGGLVVTCWSLSFIERLKILFTGKLWYTVLVFNSPLQPIKFNVNKLEAFKY